MRENCVYPTGKGLICDSAMTPTFGLNCVDEIGAVLVVDNHKTRHGRMSRDGYWNRFVDFSESNPLVQLVSDSESLVRHFEIYLLSQRLFVASATRGLAGPRNGNTDGCAVFVGMGDDLVGGERRGASPKEPGEQ